MKKTPLYTFLLLAFFITFMMYPLGYVLKGAFIWNSHLSFHFFGVMFRTDFYRDVIFNSFNLAITVTLLCTCLAYPLALLLSRARIPFYGPLHALLLLPLISPPFVGVLGIRQLLSRFGSLNVFLLDAGIIAEPINWLGGGNRLGIVVLQVIHLVPLLYLTISASLKNAHVTLEEAALMSGASRWRVLRSITIPLSLPGWFAGATLVFIASFTDLGTPLIFEYRNVISVQIYNMLSDLNENPVGYSFVVFTCFLSVALFNISKVSVMTGGFSGTGRGREGGANRQLATPLAFLALAIALSYALLACVPQVMVLALACSRDWFMSILPQTWTAHHLIEVLYHPLTARSLVISTVLSLIASGLTVIIGMLTAFRIRRGRGFQRQLFEALSLIPLAVPGIVFAFGFVGAFTATIIDNRVNPFPLLIAAYTIRRVPAMVRSAFAGLQEANVALEEASYMVGASPFKTTRRVILPLVSRHLVVGAMLTFAYSMIEVSDSLLLALEAKFYPVSKAIYSLMGRPDGIEVASALGAVVMFIMILTFYLAEVFSQRSLRARRLSCALLLIGVLGFSPAASAEDDEVVVVTPHWEGIRHEFSEAFNEQWKRETGRAVTFRWLDVGGTSDIVKYIKNQFLNSPRGIGVDLFFGGGADSFMELERAGSLASASVSERVLAAIPATLAGSPIYSPKRLWFSNAFSAFGLLYNKSAINRLNLQTPRTWSDLARPEYFDLVGAGDPRKSGSMHAMFEIILQGYGWERGWEIIQRISRNVRNYSGGASVIGKEVATGEIIYGIAIDTYAGDIIRQVGADRLGFALPEDFAAINGDGIALLKGAPHAAVATRFIEFLLSDTGQRLWYGKRGVPGGPKRYELGKLSVLPSVYGTIEPATLFQGDPFTLTNILSYDAAKAARRWNLVNDLFGAFIIDVHERLVRTDDPAILQGIPVSESLAETLSAGGSWGHDTSVRTDLIRAWGDQARKSLPVSPTMSERFKWVPSLALGTFLLLALFRQLFRRRATS